MNAPYQAGQSLQGSILKLYANTFDLRFVNVRVALALLRWSCSFCRTVNPVMNSGLWAPVFFVVGHVRACSCVSSAC